VRIEWSPTARASGRRYLHDQNGMRTIDAAVAALATDPYPAEAFHRGEYHRLRVGPYRVVYLVEDDLITVDRIDRVTIKFCARGLPPSGGSGIASPGSSFRVMQTVRVY